jgi:glutamate formiminotransferase/glutamate formiminotransferase/formiminotetrahydrofolate cyclodeaminase
VTLLLAVPNVSEGRDQQLIDRIAEAFDARRLDVHSDPDHHRSVFTLAGEPGALAEAVVAGARVATAEIDITRQEGAHPRIGAIDVAPIVYARAKDRGAACAEALVLGDRLGEELGLPVLVYGELAQGRTRHELRAGGPTVLARRIASRELVPDFGPPQFHPMAGAVLVAARPPLVAFNVELAPPATLDTARAVAGAIRETGPQGLPGVRAIGVWLEHRGVAQVSMNIEDHDRAPLAEVIAAIQRHAPVAEAELVGLAPQAALEEFPEDVPLRNRATIEDALR